MFEFSKRYCRLPIDHAVVQLVPRKNGADEVTMLELERDEPFLRLHETLYSGNAAVIGWSFIDVNSRYVTFEVFRG